MQQVAAVAGVACNKSDRIKPAEAARRLGINRSTLKRYLDNYSELVVDGTVDFEELKKHRGDNPTVAASEEAAAPAAKSSPANDSRKGSKHRVEEIKSWEAELEWARRVGQVVDPTEMIDALSDAAVALRDKFMAPDPVLCERLAGENDPRAVMTLLREANRTACADFVAAMKKITGGGEPPAAATDDASPAD